MAKSLIEQFIKEVKSDYPNLTKKQLNEICIYPFKILKRLIESDTIYSFRIKYLGVFMVFPGRLLGELKKLTSYASKSYCSPKKYWTQKNMILNYIKQNPTKFKKNEDKLKDILAKQKQAEINNGLYTR